METRLAKNAQSVELEISIAPQHADLVRKNSRFWNASGVKLNLGNILDPSLQVGSLESLVAGGIAFLTPSNDPGPPVKPGHHFALLSEEPKGLGAPATQEAKDFKVTLTADSLGGVSEGSPVFYREIQIGQVLATRLNNEASGVEMELGITSEHANLIRANSVFWNASGIKLNLGDLVDASVDVESLKSLLAGGIALINPPDAGAQAQPGATYALHPGRPDNLDRAKQTDDALQIVLRSEVQGSVKVDDPILYREVRVGKVTGVGLGEDADYVALQVAIEPEYAPLVRAKTVFWNASGIHASFGLFSGADIDIESLSALLRGGIAFATPKDGGPAAQGGATYTLHSEPKKEWQAWAPHIRLPQETPKEESTAPASSDAPLPAPAKPESAGGAPIANAPTSEPDLTAPAHSAETVDLPAAISVSGEHLSTSALTEALAKAGFSNIDNIRRSGSIAHADVDWQGEAVALRIDTRTGRIEKTD